MAGPGHSEGHARRRDLGGGTKDEVGMARCSAWYAA